MSRETPVREVMTTDVLTFTPEDTVQTAGEAMAATVGDVMTPHPKTCTETDTVEEVATMLHEHNLSRLPVVRDGRLVGIVARGDILKEIVKKGP
ncbi:MAG: CBS domain-containing protein [Acidimicrobiia bacterium]|nr:CBS domain-containing protein [Acidimicrobiia bacterium]